MGILESIISLFTEYIPSFFKWIWQKVRYYWFKIFSDKNPIANAEAKQIAQAVLSGHIEEAKSFRNIGSPKSYICVFKRENLEAVMTQLVVLEQVGETFIPIYKKELHKLPSDWEIIDIDKDGIHEIAYIIKDAGSGADSKTLEIYSLEFDKHYSISEFRDHSDSTTSDSPKVSFDKGVDPTFKSYLENYAVKKGFLKRDYVDLQDPKNAVLNWHRMNGEKEEGEVKLHFYEGAPKYGSSIIETIETDFVKWVAHFKGPIYGVLKAKNQHFVAFSPSNKYNWATCIAAFPDKILFGTNSREGLYLFEYYNTSGDLKFFEKIGWRKLPYVTKLELNKNRLLINNSLEVSIEDIIGN